MNFEQYYSSEYSLNSPSSSSGTDQRLSSYSSFESNQTLSGTDHRLSSYRSFESNQVSSFLSSPSDQLVSHKKRAGRKKFKETRHPIYRGVRERKNDKWVCEVREPGNSKSRIWLGTHNSPEMAARAYDVAALALRGESTPLNFEDSLWRLPRAKSSSAKDIQSAVAESYQALLSTESQSSAESSTFQFSRRVETNVEEFQESSSGATFLDEEALFNMPSLMASMAEGMLIDPPQEGYFFDDVECSYSPYSSEYSLNSPSSSSGTDQRLCSYNNFESNQTSSFLWSPSELVSHKKRAGRKKFKETRHPIYRGVRERKNDKWVCEVREPNSQSRIWLGTHNSPEMAARAYDVAALALRGESTPLNFEDSLWRLPRAKSSSAKDIQSAVAESYQALLSTESSTFKVSRRLENNVEEIQESSSTMTFLDEEAVFNMPSLMASMAEGMLLDPPQGYFFDDVECSVVCNLWSD
ncbi:hypothetical protein MKX01_042465 [Papaver californicum]|nr:hypothetical protein MKX01_042465 [Papaver californicum]